MRSPVPGIAVGVVLAALLVPNAAAANALPRAGRSAAPSTLHDQLRPLAGSSQFLVFSRFARTGQGTAHTGALYAMARSGTTSKLATIRHSDTGFSLTGSSLVYADPKKGTIYWWDLAADRHGHTKARHPNLQPQLPLSAAPGGWLLRHTETKAPYHSVLDRESTDGTVTTLGEPFPHGGTISFGGYGVGAGAHQLVAFGNSPDDSDNVKTVVMDLKHPAVRRTLVPTGPGFTNCGQPMAGLVACAVIPVGHGAGSPTVRLLGLAGKRAARTTQDCPPAYDFAAPAVLNTTAAAWITETECKAGAGQLEVMGFSGQVTSSTLTFADSQPIPAFGEIVVMDVARTSIELVSGADATPTVLVHVPSSS
jgi:hypothetical protein